MDYQKIAANTIIQILGKALTTIIGLVTIGLLLRYLGQTGYGEYTTILVFVGIFSTLTDLGLYIIHVREISKVENYSRITSSILTLRLLAGLIILSLAPILAWLFFPYSASVKLGILVAAISFFFISLYQILFFLFQKNFQIF